MNAAIDMVYEGLLAVRTDMRVHLPVLRRMAIERVVTEFGTRRGISTCALVAGRPLKLTCYDMVRQPDVDQIETWAEEAGVPFVFVEKNLDEVTEIEPTNFLFIDAMHNGRDVRHYLALGEAAGMWTCALHDTDIFGRTGDVPGTDGIMDAVDEFLRAHPQWQITYQSRADYGFTVIDRT